MVQSKLSSGEVLVRAVGQRNHQQGAAEPMERLFFTPAMFRLISEFYSSEVLLQFEDEEFNQEKLKPPFGSSEVSLGL